MTGFRSNFILLAAAAALAASQNLSNFGVSQQCQDTLNTAFANSELSSCLQLFNAIDIFEKPANASVITPVDDWLLHLCGAPLCSNDTLSQAAQNITTGCQSDLNNVGIDPVEAKEIVKTLVPIYPTIRKVACLADNKDINHSLCVTEVLTDLQSAIGNVTLDKFLSIIQAALGGSSGGINFPKNVACNNCTEAAWVIIRDEVPAAAFDTQLTGAIASQCGKDFVNASQPTDIVESTGLADTGAAVGSHMAFIGLAVVPLISVFAGTALLM